MHAHTLPSRQGLQWLSNSFRIYGKAQVRMPLVVLCYMAIGMVMLMFGAPGLLLFFLLDPMFSVGLTNLSHRVDQGVKVDPGVIFSGFLKKPGTLLALGTIYAGVMFVVFLLALLLFVLAFGDAPLREFAELLEQTGSARKDISPEMFASITRLFQITLFLHIPPSVVFWHASILIAWHDLPKGKALFFSLVGCLRNWRAFLVYVAAIFIVMVLIPNLVLGMLAKFAFGLRGLVAVSFVFMLLVINLWCVGLYVSYRDIFATIDETA
ncbi:MAG: DUF2189 domain-containing protein [Candidatus Accumulibacter sp.]|nr:DUF2189 domain-containing protein [Accumulibacter sp.]